MNDDLGKHFIYKKPPEFWKVGNAKFERNITSQDHLNGCTSDEDISIAFATHFCYVYCQFAADKVDVDCFSHRLNCTTSTHCDTSTEAIETAVNNIKLGNAFGPDDLSIEHFHYAHPAVYIHQKLLFTLLSSHEIVPVALSFGIVIPLVEGKTSNINGVDCFLFV